MAVSFHCSLDTLMKPPFLLLDVLLQETQKMPKGCNSPSDPQSIHPEVVVIPGRNLLRPGNAGKHTAPLRSPSYHALAQLQTDHRVLTHRWCRPPSPPWRAQQ